MESGQFSKECNKRRQRGRGTKKSWVFDSDNLLRRLSLVLTVRASSNIFLPGAYRKQTRLGFLTGLPQAVSLNIPACAQEQDLALWLG